MEAIKMEPTASCNNCDDTENREAEFFREMNKKTEFARFRKELDADLHMHHVLHIRYKRAWRGFWLSCGYLFAMAAMAAGVYAAAYVGLIAQLLMRWLLPPVLMSAGWNAKAAMDQILRMEKIRKEQIRREGCL